MDHFTRALWDSQNRHEGDRQRLFEAIAGSCDAETVLYPGSFVDIAPSFVFPSVTYVDSDNRAARFFADRNGVREIIASPVGSPPTADFTFIHADYSTDLPIEPESFDLLISLYAGFVSAHCTRYLSIGGALLVNLSHGDAALSSIDERYVLSGVVKSRQGRYRVTSDDLNTYLSPKKPQPITRSSIIERGRGVAYTKPSFAYLFTRIG